MTTGSGPKTPNTINLLSKSQLERVTKPSNRDCMLTSEETVKWLLYPHELQMNKRTKNLNERSVTNDACMAFWTVQVNREILKK